VDRGAGRAAAAGPQQDFSPQIVGGQQATTVPAGSVALILFNSGGSTYSCSGALVASRWVLTAAHCLVQFANGLPTRSPNDAGSYQVYVGSNSSGTARAVSQIVLNDGYLQRSSAEDVPGYRDSGNVWRNGTPGQANDAGLDDFGLLRLDADVAAPPLRLATDDSIAQAGRVVWAAGWGLTSGSGGSLPTELQEAQLTMANSSYCEIAWHRYYSATSSACYQGLSDLGQSAATCNGDSGGPVLSRDETGAWWIVAVISGGPSNCPVNQPYVGVRSAWAAPWVANVTGADISGRVGESINPLVPQRIVDSRIGQGVSFVPPTVYEPSSLGIFRPEPTLPANFVTRRPLYGPNGVAGLPTGGLAGVIMNVTVESPAGPGFLAVYPCVDGWGGTSNLNFEAGQTVANLVVTKADRNGDVCFLTSERTALIADLTGWLGYDSVANRAATAAAPVRLLDTRDTAKVPAGGMVTVQVTGAGAAPAGARAAVLNLTATETEAAGYVTAWPCDAAQPFSSNLNPVVGRDVANAVVVKLDGAGRACLFSASPTHLVVDLNGWVADAGQGTIKTVPPARLADTRLVRATPWPGGTPLILHVAGAGGVPASGVAAVALNVTVTEPVAGGYLVVYPCGEVPTASNLNFAAGQTVPNAVLAKVDGSGNVCLLSPLDTHLVVDVTAYVRG
jgi:hypothetical protein